jgi:hypothetical protein
MLCNPKQNFISPLESVGTVVMNARVESSLITGACLNDNPYYPLANGKYRECMGVVDRGQILFTYYTRQESIDCLVVDPLLTRRDNCRIKGVTMLNGLGDATQSNWDLMAGIQIQGIVERANPGSDLFNDVIGGIHDVKNNGNETINVGDRVMAYAPSHEELGKGSGCNQSAEEKAGVVRLWYKPYKPELHRNQLKQIYQCLTDHANARACLPEFKRHCRTFTDSAAGMAMVMLAQYLPTLRKQVARGAAVGDADILVDFLTKVGHSEFKGTAADEASRAATRDALFVPFSTDSRNATQHLFSNLANASKSEKALATKLNAIQQKSTGLFLESTAVFIKYITNLIIGQAKSTARPGYDFSLEMISYTK